MSYSDLNLSFINNNIANIINSKSDDEVIMSLSKQPDNLIEFFKVISEQKKDWIENHTDSYKNILTKIKDLNSVGLLDNEQIKKIVGVNKSIYKQLGNENIKLNILHLFDQSINESNVYDYLGFFHEVKAEMQIRQCLNIIEKMTGVTLRENDNKLDIEILTPEVSLEEFRSKHLDNLIKIYSHSIESKDEFSLSHYDDNLISISPTQIRVILCADSLSEFDSVEKFTEKAGNYISKLIATFAGRDSGLKLKKLIENCPNLKDLNISRNELTAADLENLPKSLEKLELINCKSLQNLPTSLPDELRTLNLNDCESLQNLPTSLPEGLTMLDLTNCKNLKVLSNTFPNTLFSINLHQCKSVLKLPEVLPCQLCLLDLSGCESLLELPDLLSTEIRFLDLSGCKHLQKLPNRLPETLKSLYLNGCSTLIDLPDRLPDSVKSFSCINSNLSEDTRVKWLLNFFESDIELGFDHVDFFDVTDYPKLGNSLAEKIDLSVWKNHVPNMRTRLPLQAVIPIAVKMMKEEVIFFLENYDSFQEMMIHIPACLAIDIATRIKNEEVDFFLENYHYFLKAGLHIELLKQITNGYLCFNINEDQVQKKTSKIGTIQLAEVSNVDREDLLQLFNEINFTDPNKAGYKNPEKLTIDGMKATKEMIRDGIVKLVSRINNLEAYTAVPREESERRAWYEKLDKIIKNVVKQARESKEQEVVAGELISLGGAGYFCGARWMRDGMEALKTLSGGWAQSLEGGGLEGKIDGWVDGYKEGIIQEMVVAITPKNLMGMQPHYYNFVGKIMKEMGYMLSEDLMIDEADAEPPFDFNVSAFKEWLRATYFSNPPINFVKYIRGRLEEELRLNGNLVDSVINTMRASAETQLSSELNAIENSLENQKLEKGVKVLAEEIENHRIRSTLLANRINSGVDISHLGAMKRRAANNEIDSQLRRLVELDTKWINLNEEVMNANNEEERSALEAKRDALEEAIGQEQLEPLKIKMDQEIKRFETLDNAGIRELGAVSAISLVRGAKDELIDAFLVSKKLLIYDENNFPQLTLIGVMSLLKYLKYLQ